jgi:hypothetical protein
VTIRAIRHGDDLYGLAAGRHRPAIGLGDEDTDVLAGLDVRRIAPPQLIPEIVGQRLADNVHTLENLPALTVRRYARP